MIFNLKCLIFNFYFKFYVWTYISIPTKSSSLKLQDNAEHTQIGRLNHKTLMLIFANRIFFSDEAHFRLCSYVAYRGPKTPNTFESRKSHGIVFIMVISFLKTLKVGWSILVNSERCRRIYFAEKSILIWKTCGRQLQNTPHWPIEFYCKIHFHDV